jgi:hypothetical protein
VCYLLVETILIGFWATKDDHDLLDIGVVIIRILIVVSLLGFVQGVALRCLLTTLLGDMLPIRVAVLSQMVHQEAMVLAFMISSNLPRFPLP